jgi:hypothetical protein
MNFSIFPTFFKTDFELSPISVSTANSRRMSPPSGSSRQMLMVLPIYATTAFAANVQRVRWDTKRANASLP